MSEEQTGHCDKCGADLVAQLGSKQPPALQLIGLFLRVSSILMILLGLTISGFTAYLGLQMDKEFGAVRLTHKILWEERETHLRSVTLSHPPASIIEFDKNGALTEKSKNKMPEDYRRLFLQTYRWRKQLADSQLKSALLFKFLGLLGLILTIPGALLIRYVGNQISLPKKEMVCLQCIKEDG